MAKKFLYVGIGLLFLASTSQAVPVDPNAPDGVAAVYSDGGALYALGADGQSWILVMANLDGWLPTTWPSLPPGMAVADISDWTTRYLVTSDGVRWMYNLEPLVMAWVEVPPLPGGVIGNSQGSLGDAKSLFR